MAVPADVVGRVCRGDQFIGLVVAVVLRFHNGRQIGKRKTAAVQRVDGEHSVVTGGGIGPVVIDPVNALFAWRELVPNGGLVSFVFAFFHRGVRVVAPRASNRGDIGVRKIVVVGTGIRSPIRHDTYIVDQISVFAGRGLEAENFKGSVFPENVDVSVQIISDAGKSHGDKLTLGRICIKSVAQIEPFVHRSCVGYAMLITNAHGRESRF